MMEGPVLAMVLEAPHAVELVRRWQADTSTSCGTGTLEAITALILVPCQQRPRAVKNLLHASGTKDEAEYEIPLWLLRKKSRL